MAFTLDPVYSSVYYGRTAYNVFFSPEWVGQENYGSLLSDDQLLRTALWFTLDVAVLGRCSGSLTTIPLMVLLNAKVRRRRTAHGDRGVNGTAVWGVEDGGAGFGRRCI